MGDHGRQAGLPEQGTGDGECMLALGLCMFWPVPLRAVLKETFPGVGKSINEEGKKNRFHLEFNFLFVVLAHT